MLFHFVCFSYLNGISVYFAVVFVIFFASWHYKHFRNSVIQLSLMCLSQGTEVKFTVLMHQRLILLFKAPYVMASVVVMRSCYASGVILTPSHEMAAHPCVFISCHRQLGQFRVCIDGVDRVNDS